MTLSQTNAEMLHPFVNALYLQNPILFNNLLKEAKTSFPKLRLEISEAYKKETATVRNQELVTQALARAFRQETEEHPEKRQVSTLLSKFVEWIRGILSIGEKTYILTDEIKPDTTIVELAKLLNTDLELLYNSKYANITMSNVDNHTHNDYVSHNGVYLTNTNNNTYVLGVHDLETGNQNITKDDIFECISTKIRQIKDNSDFKVGSIIGIDENSYISKNIVKIISGLKQASKYYPLYLNKILPFTEDFDNETKRKIQSLGFNGIPSYIFGKTKSDIDIAEKQEQLLNYEGVDAKTIRGLANLTAVIFIQNLERLKVDDNAKSELFKKDMYNDVDFKGMTSEQIISTIGIDNALYYLGYMPAIENCPADNDTVENDDLALLIYKNLKPFMMLASDILLENANIVINNNGVATFTTQNNEMVVEDENGSYTDFQEESDDSPEETSSKAEGWQVKFREVDPIFSTSEKIRIKLSTMVDTSTIENSKGILKPKTKLNILGYGNPLDVDKCISQLYEWTLGAESLDDKDASGNYKPTSMVGMLQSRMKENGWLCQLVGDYFPNGIAKKYVGIDADDLKEVEVEPEKGLLIDGRKENEQFRSLFFVNFSKTFQNYLYLGERNGKAIIKEVNKRIYIEDYKRSYMDLVDDLNFPKLKNEKNELDIEKVESFIDYFTQHIWLNTEDGFVDYLKDPDHLQECKKQINAAFDVLGLPSINRNLSKRLQNEESIRLYHRDVILPIVKIFRTIRRNEKNEASSISGYIERLLVLIDKEEGNAYIPNTSLGRKKYFSYVVSSKLNRIIEKLKKGDFSEYEKYNGWFVKERNSFSGEVERYYSGWLDLLWNGSGFSNKLEHAVLLADRNVEYRDKNRFSLLSSILHCFFYAPNSQYGWYRVFVLSNKPSEEYIRFVKFTNRRIESEIKNTFLQECNRIAAIKERRKAIKNNEEIKIKNYDDNGDKFHFLKMLNNPSLELINEEGDTIDLRKDLDNYLEGKLVEGPQIQEEYSTTDTSLNTFIENIAAYIMQEKIKDAENWLDSLEKKGFLTIDKSGGSITYIQDPTLKDQLNAVLGNKRFIWGYSHKDLLINFYLNDWHAQINILQLTVDDIAMYSNAEDLNKRIAQIHSSTYKPHKGATYNGAKVSDGNYRTVIIEDPTNVASDVITKIKKALKDEKLFKNKGDAYLRKALQDILPSLEKSFKNIDWTDGQGLTCPSAYRKRMIMYGKWSEEDEDLYNVLKGNTEMDEHIFKTAWTPIKAFVYSIIPVNGHNSIIPTIPKGIQIKYSEYCITLAAALARKAGIDTALGDIYEVMEESYAKNPTTGLDTVVFKSTVKVGLQNVVPYSKNESIKDKIKKRIYKEDGSYNEEYVQTIDFTDSGIQQEVLSHWNEHTSKPNRVSMGSQARIIPITNVPNTDAEGKPNTIQIRETLGGKVVKTLDVKQAKARYLQLISDNIELSIQSLNKRFYLKDSNGLDSSPTVKNIALSNELVIILSSNARYADLLSSCKINDKGDFILPLSDLVNSNRIQQLINSIVSKKIWKQEYAGGLLVQASSYGLSKDLRIVKNPDGTIAYAEAIVPVYDDALLSFKDENGNIDIKAIEKKNPKLLDMLGYRIPTEAVYSTIPIKVVGFMEGSEAIMLPKEITKYAGSDFDVDKLNVVRYEFVKEFPLRDIKNNIWESFKVIVSTQDIQNYINGNKKALDNIENVDDEVLQKIQEYLDSVTVDFVNPREGTRAANNNEILDLMFAFLYSPLNLKRFTTPGGYTTLKQSMYYIAATKLLSKDAELREEFIKNNEELFTKVGNDYILKKDADTSKLKDLIFKKSDPLTINSHIDFHEKNMVAAKLTSIFAKLLTTYGICSIDCKPTMMLSNKNIECNICGTAFKSIDKSSNGYYIYSIAPMYESKEVVNENEGKEELSSEDNTSRYVSENISECVAAVLDAVKDSVFPLVNVNMETINVYTACLLAGMSLHNANLFVSQPVIEELCNEYYKSGKSMPFSFFLNSFIKGKAQNNDKLIAALSAKLQLKSEELEKRIKGVLYEDEKVNVLFDLAVLLAFRQVLTYSGMFREISAVTRMNSSKAGNSPTVTDSLEQQLTINDFESKYKGVTYKSNDEVIPTYNKILGNPLIKSFAKSSLETRNSIFSNHFLESTQEFIDLFSYYRQRTKKQDKYDLYRFTNFVKSFYLNCPYITKNKETITMFDSSMARRQHVLYDFPKQVESIVKSDSRYADNKLVQAIRIVTSKDDENRKDMLINTKYLLKYRIKELREAYEDLYFKDPKLAWGLAEYSFYTNGVSFSNKGFLSLLPDVMKTNKNDMRSIIYDSRSRHEDVELLNVYKEDIVNQYMMKQGYADSYESRKSVSDEDLSEVYSHYEPNVSLVKYKDAYVYIDRKQSPNTAHIIPFLSGNTLEAQSVKTSDIKLSAVTTNRFIDVIEDRDYSVIFTIEDSESIPMEDSTENIAEYIADFLPDKIRKAALTDNQVEEIVSTLGISNNIIDSLAEKLDWTIIKEGSEEVEKQNLCTI